MGAAGAVVLGMRKITMIVAAVVAAGGLVGGAAAQDGVGGKDPGEGDGGMTLREALSFAQTEAQAVRRSGLRASLIGRAARAVPVVMVVEDEGRFLEAVSGWEWPVRYPVLFDDGSVRAHEQIARFVRAYGAEKVVRVSGEDDEAPRGEVWGGARSAREGAVRRALARSVRDAMGDADEALGALRGEGIVSPGVVVIDVDDGLWAGGLALAAGRAQRVVFVSTDDRARETVSRAGVAALSRTVESALTRWGVSWDTIGDEIDAVTLAMEISVRGESGLERVGIAATTDMVGRSGGGVGERWAHCGQLFGSVSDGVYQAMCSLFLPIGSAWVWDGYGSGGEWDAYDGTEAGAVLEGAGVTTVVRDEPRNTLRAFELASASGAVDADLLMMNSKGTRLYYDLPGAPAGSGRPGDVPVLGRPAALHMVHSFSLEMPRYAWSVGGRWLLRGVYVYAGSVDEPYLTGFVPTPEVARRLTGTLAFAAAVHYDNAPVWKIAVIGDPLKTLGPGPTRLETEGITLGGPGVDVRERMRARLGARDLSGAMEDLSVLGEDAGLVRLARAGLGESPEKVSGRGALVAMHAAVREREFELALDLFERLGGEERATHEARDMLWLAGRSLLARVGDTRALALMRVNLRENMRVRDAVELAEHVKRSRSAGAAVGLLESVRGELDKGWEKKKLDEAVARIRR